MICGRKMTEALIANGDAKQAEKILSINSKKPHGNTLKRIRTFTLVPFMALAKNILQFLSLMMNHLNIHLAIKRSHVLLLKLEYFMLKFMDQS